LQGQLERVKKEIKGNVKHEPCPAYRIHEDSVDWIELSIALRQNMLTMKGLKNRQNISGRTVTKYWTG
jgi:hypothetical protein